MSQEQEPIFLDVGKVKKRKVKDLERGRGRLMDEVERVLAEAAARFEPTDEEVELVPVVIVFGSKRKRKKRRSGLLGGG